MLESVLRTRRVGMMGVADNGKVLTRRRGVRVGAVAMLAGVLVVAGCGSDGESAQDQYCAAGESLETSLDELADLDLVAEGTDGLTAAVDQVRSDLADLRDSASDAAADEVGALEQAVDDLNDAISALGGELTSDNASSVGAAIENVAAATQSVLDTLSDC